MLDVIHGKIRAVESLTRVQTVATLDTCADCGQRGKTSDWFARYIFYSLLSLLYLSVINLFHSAQNLLTDHLSYSYFGVGWGRFWSINLDLVHMLRTNNLP